MWIKLKRMTAAAWLVASAVVAGAADVEAASPYGTTSASTVPSSVDASSQTNVDQSQSFQDGITTGQQALNPSTATDTNTAQSLPSYSSNPPEAQYANDPTSAQATGQSRTSTSEAYNIGSSAKQGVDQNASLTNGTDPLFQQSGPQATIGVQFSGCSTVAGTGVGATTTQTCTGTPELQNALCARTLSVAVDRQDSCQLGTAEGTVNLYSLINPSKGWYCNAQVTVMCGPQLDGVHTVNVNVQTQGHSYWAGSTSFLDNTAALGLQTNQVLGLCGYAFYNNGCDASGICTLSFNDGYNWASIQFRRSEIIITQTDNWTDGCAPLEARVAP